MYGGAGNDVYFVDNTGDVVIENANEGNDTVFASIDYGLGANVENLIAARQCRSAGLRQRPGQRDVRQPGNNILDGMAAPTTCSAAPATTSTSSTMPATW